jgi:DNA-binding MarR family transcriptional regulator
MERVRELAASQPGGLEAAGGSAASSGSRRRQAVELCARQILEVVPRAMRFLRGEMRREAGAGVSVPQFRVLVFLGRTPGTSLSTVARHVGIADATASVMVSRLVERGLVSRTSDPSERRRVMLRLTQRGTTLLERARAHARLRMAERLDALSGEELAAVAGALTLLERALGPAGEGSRP